MKNYLKPKYHKAMLCEYWRTRREHPTYPVLWAFRHARQWAEILAIQDRPDVEIEVIAEQDDCPVRGNALVSGDDETDRNCENEILRRLDNGDVWAWALVEVKVTLNGESESDYLGCCCYKDESDFRRNSGYFYDMLTGCLERLESEQSEQQEMACRGVVTA